MMNVRMATNQENESLLSKAKSFGSRKPRLISVAISTVLGVALYIVNNLGVLHALLAAPKGYVAIGLDRDSDVAMHVTWIQGLTHQWLLPNYHAAWQTTPGLVVPAMTAIARLSSWSGLSVVVSLQAFQLFAYVLTAYAAAFALATFCDSRREKLAALVAGIACVPVRSVLQPIAVLLHHPDWQHLGAQDFLVGTDGFFRGITNWPLLTFGAFSVALALPLTARYLLTRNVNGFGCSQPIVFSPPFFIPLRSFLLLRQ